MPPSPRTHCKLEDCGKPAHVYPSGAKATYCSEHLRLRKAKQRQGHATMTGSMLAVLQYLSSMKAQEQPFVELRYPLAHGITIRELFERDWIFESSGLDGVRYTITGRGEQALKAYDQPINRRDDICPECGERPRHVRTSGKKDAYCHSCLRAIGKRKRDLGIQYIDTSRCCSRCHKRPLYQYPGGTWSTYCKHCSTVVRRKNARKLRRQRFLSIQQGGEIPLCKKCRQAPIRVFLNTVSDFCTDCGRQQIRKFKLKSALMRSLPSRPRKRPLEAQL